VSVENVSEGVRMWEVEAVHPAIGTLAVNEVTSLLDQVPDPSAFVNEFTVDVCLPKVI
jgi:hypothetical protein